MKDAVITFKVERSFKEKLLAAAEAEGRSLSNYIEQVLKREIAARERKGHSTG